MLPDVPPIRDSGVAGYESGSWVGLLAPARTPAKITSRLNAAAVKVVRSPAVHARLEGLGAEPVGSASQEFGARIRREHEQHGRIVKTAGVRIE